ncbi:hypothetical protein [Halalkalibacter okhensis]|uniref:Uncharacterized protein n=1 Tax=Halalkalibacter okhensis TaxID=333138 RepID=A0A0B0I7T4_9BACI|nr:hypothetical protein [Halalkalibacter okhensis]KHF38538.1 hypothetical protein LQ50_20505 [Halalkalibacter okhensis]
MNRDLSLQQIAEGMTKSLLNASDKDLEGFQKIIDATLELREAHKDLQKMVQSYSNSGIQRSVNHSQSHSHNS